MSYMKFFFFFFFLFLHGPRGKHMSSFRHYPHAILYLLVGLALSSGFSIVTKGDVEWRSEMANYTLLFYFHVFLSTMFVGCLFKFSFVASYT